MLQNDTAVFHAFAWNPVEAEYNDWRGMGTRAAIAVRLKLKGLCITARRSGSRKDGSISQKAANKGGEKISSSRERKQDSAVPCDHATIARPLTPLLWHRSPVLRNTDCSQAAWSSHRGDTLQWPPLPTEGATCSLPHHPRTHHRSHRHPARRPVARLHHPPLPQLPPAQ